MLTRLVLTLMLVGLAGFMPVWGPPGPALAASAATLDGVNSPGLPGGAPRR